MLQRFSRNTAGRDFAVGDVHGHFSRLRAALAAVNFDPKVDRLFSVGDLVDRGPECTDALNWLALPWFHAVRGNHEDYAVRFAAGNPVDAENYRRNGGGWFLDLPHPEQQRFGTAFAALPIAIEVETSSGAVGILHADCPMEAWWMIESVFSGEATASTQKRVREECMWSRKRFEGRDEAGVQGLRAVVVGHTPVTHPVWLGNVVHIDTKGWAQDGSGDFTFLRLDTLQTVQVSNGK
jgi:serine/threonine protein phosphatase 1